MFCLPEPHFWYRDDFVFPLHSASVASGCWNMQYSPAMSRYRIGQHIMVKLSGGRIVEATIRAIVEHTDGLRLQVDFGQDETALIEEWQIVKEP
jgi:hypothetical protein